MIGIEYTEKKSNTVSIDEALHACGVVQLLKEEVVRMEKDARWYYEKADEYYELRCYFKSNYYRQQGNVLMERVCALKQIMECGRE